MQSLTSVDVYFLSRELSMLDGSRVKAVYDCAGGFRLKIRLATGQETHLLIAPPKLLLITRFPEAPLKPSSQAMLLRKHLENATIKSVRQEGMDRIVTITFGHGPIVHVELLSKANIVLERDGAIVWSAEKDEKRGIAKGKPYALPENKARAIDELEEYSNAKEVARFAGLPTMYVEEALKGVSSLEGAKNALKELFSRDLKPALYYQEGKLAGFAPFPVSKFAGMERKAFATFSAALEEYFEHATPEESEQPTASSNKAEKLQASLEQQRKAIVVLQENEKKDRERAEFILANQAAVEELLALAKARKMDELAAKAGALGFSKVSISGKSLRLQN